MNTRHNQASETDEAQLSQFGARVCGQLDQGAAELPQQAAQRLYAARNAALQRQAAPVPIAALPHAGLGQWFGNSWHAGQRYYRGALAFLALAVGVAGVQLWQNVEQANEQATELAAIDSELLSDELPPSAYTDPGFLKWLQQASESDDDSPA
jgi:hypothetical protein